MASSKTAKLREYQDQHNENRRIERAEKARIKFTTPREGACEDIVHKFVSQIFKRLLKRKRNNASRKHDPVAKDRVKLWREEKKQEAAARGITFRQLMKERSDEHKKKPLVFANPQEHHKVRMKKDDAYAARYRLSKRLCEFVHLKNGNQANEMIEMLGCNQEELIAHLGITQNQRGKLTNNSIDHIFPMTLYDVMDENEVKKMMNFTNLRMMPLDNNSSKGAQLPSKADVAGIPSWVYPPGVFYNALED